MEIRRALLSIVLAAAAFGAAAEPVSVAFVGTVNAGGDPRFDYLQPLITSLVLYDLSSVDALALSDRGMLENVLREQELGINLGKGEAAKLGGILGADWVLKAEYAVMGQDLTASLTLVNVETGQTFAFADRGDDENLVHGLAEKAVKKLCGADAAFRSEQRRRSLLSLKDVKPGSVSLHCALIDAQIFLDGEFAAYSLGNVRTPVKLEDVEPGKHVLTVKLSGFGMVKLPEVEYVDWEKTVDVLPGKNLVVKVDANLFSEWFYQLSLLADEQFTLLPESGKDAKEFRKTYPFTDRQGKERPISIAFKAARDANGGSMSGELSIDGKTVPIALACANRKEEKAEVRLGPAKAIVWIDLHNPARNDYRIRLERTDIEFGEWER